MNTVIYNPIEEFESKFKNAHAEHTNQFFEKLVQQSLERLAVGRTTLTIAHRLTTIKNADRIVVLTEDGIAETGTHHDLIERGGLYADLYRMYTTD